MKSKSEVKPYLTTQSALDDLGFTQAETLELKVKAEIYRDLLQYIRDQGFSQQQLAVVLGVHQPDVSNLLNGRVSKFSVGKLIKFAGKLNLSAQVKLSKPRAGTIKAASGETASPASLPDCHALAKTRFGLLPGNR